MKSRRRAPRRWDGRSWQARFIRAKRADLIAQLGKTPNPTQAVLVDILCSTALDLEIMERDRPVEGGRSLHDHRVVLAYRNTLRRTAAALGLKDAEAAEPTLEQYLATKDRQPGREPSLAA